MKYVVRKEEDKLFLWEIGEPTEHCTDGQTYIPSKKIGVVSPEATWVKEGDEFNEDEIAAIYEPGEDMDTEYILISQFDKWLKDLNERRSIGYKYKRDSFHFAIKGPCGHFH